METEKEFLANYSLDKYPRPSVTTDVAAFMMRNEESGNYRKNPQKKLSLLLIKRARHPYKGCWALPGGFFEPGETVEECAIREITEETNVVPSTIIPIGVFSESGRDPRGWIISNAFVSVICEDNVNEIGGDDASDASWFDVSFIESQKNEFLLKLVQGEENVSALLVKKRTDYGKEVFEIKECSGLAFDHAKIIASAVAVLRSGVKNLDIIFDFLPEKFTLAALQKVQETILDASVVPANFRRKIAEYVVETDEMISGAGHRPAKLYKRK